MTLVGHFEPSLTGVLAIRRFLGPETGFKATIAILDQVVPTMGRLVAWTTAPAQVGNGHSLKGFIA